MCGTLSSVRKRRTVPGDQAEAGHAGGLLAGVHQDLHAEADAQHRAAGGDVAVDRSE